MVARKAHNLETQFESDVRNSEPVIGTRTDVSRKIGKMNWEAQ